MKVAILFLLVSVGVAASQQIPDPDFDAAIAHPSYQTTHPRVSIDQAHENFHTKDGLFKPFADLLRNDGYDVVANSAKFTSSTLSGIKIMVISNATGKFSNDNNNSTAAFTKSECDVLYEWVRQGGSLFLIADHAPMGDAAALLAGRFGVILGNGFVFDSNTKDFDRDDVTELVFSEDNHLLGGHPITRGRNERERLHRLVAFTGESLTVPPKAVTLLELSATAGEVHTRAESELLQDPDATKAKARREEAARKWPVAGKAMAVALNLGSGRVVISGEAGMMTAQVFKDTAKDGTEKLVGKTGMGVPGNDDEQYVLNILHWLSGLLN